MTFQDNVKHKTDWQANLQQDNILKAKKVVIWDFRDRDELDTFWFSDVHLGHHACDEDHFKRNVDMVGENDMPVMDLGDLIENSTRDSVGSGVYDQVEIAEAQMARAVEMYQPIKGLIQGMHPGNHEMRTYNKSGVNLTRFMARELGVPYVGAGTMHLIRVGKQTYTGYSHHGGSGATTVGGKLNAMKRPAGFIDADFIINGHLHDCLHNSMDTFYLDLRSKTVKSRTKHLIQNGAYLNWWNTYGQVKAYEPGTKGNAQISFSGERKEIRVQFK